VFFLMGRFPWAHDREDPIVLPATKSHIMDTRSSSSIGWSFMETNPAANGVGEVLILRPTTPLDILRIP
jgi:hypothetical protein